MKKQKIYSLVLGGYINGYSIIKELYDKDLRNIALLSYGRSLASYSNKIIWFQSIAKTSQSLKDAIINLKKKCDYIVIFPTDDLQLEYLHDIYADIKEFCFIPFNYNNVLQNLDKYVQYSYCEKYDIPYPKTKNIQTIEDIEKIEGMMFPVLVKPNKRNDINTDVFRSLFLDTIDDYNKNIGALKYFINKNITFLASEFIPGDDTNIYAYVGYCSQDGKILNEWIGKKLTQYPDNFGVFSSGSNQAPEIIREQGRKLFEVMDLKGICEPEFKYDSRDGKYKLMEINLRSMMWHRVGNLSGVNIQYSQYLDAIGEDVSRQIQNQEVKVHYIYMKHEIQNLVFRKDYWKHFNNNVFGCGKREFAVYDKKDIKPLLFDLIDLLKGLVSQCLKVLNLR